MDEFLTNHIFALFIGKEKYHITPGSLWSEVLGNCQKVKFGCHGNIFLKLKAVLRKNCEILNFINTNSKKRSSLNKN